MLRPDELALLESGVSLIVGTVDGDGAPDATRAWGVRGDPDGLRVLCDEAAGVSVANLRAGGRIAVTGVDVVTLRSIQVKGRALAVEAATADDRAVFREYCDEVVAAISRVQGVPPDLPRRLMPARLLAVTCSVDAVFDQTPGPSAGDQLAPR